MLTTAEPAKPYQVGLSDGGSLRLQDAQHHSLAEFACLPEAGSGRGFGRGLSLPEQPVQLFVEEA